MSLMLKSLWVRYQRMTYLDPVAQSVSKGCSQGASQCYSLLKAWRGQDLVSNSFMWLLAEFSSLLVVGQRSPLVPCLVGCPIGQLTIQAHQVARKAVVRRWKSQVLFFGFWFLVVFLYILFVKHFYWNTIPLQSRKTLTK